MLVETINEGIEHLRGVRARIGPTDAPDILRAIARDERLADEAAAALARGDRAAAERALQSAYVYGRDPNFKRAAVTRGWYALPGKI